MLLPVVVIDDLFLEFWKDLLSQAVASQQSHVQPVVVSAQEASARMVVQVSMRKILQKSTVWSLWNIPSGHLHWWWNGGLTSRFWGGWLKWLNAWTMQLDHYQYKMTSWKKLKLGCSECIPGCLHCLYWLLPSDCPCFSECDFLLCSKSLPDRIFTVKIQKCGETLILCSTL